MRENLTLLGLDVNEDTTMALVEDIDLDNSGDIDEEEFSAWMGKPLPLAHKCCIYHGVALHFRAHGLEDKDGDGCSKDYHGAWSGRVQAA